jgi:uncharacterized membrane protein affecting hemolysin expression
MSDVKLPDGVSAWEMIVFIVALIVAVSGFLVAVVKGWEAWKKISVRDRVKALEGRMDKVEARLSLGDKRFELQSDDLGHLLNTQLAMLIHMKSGNDKEKLDKQIESLTLYMSQRATKAAAYAAEHNQLQNGGTNE